MKLVPLHTHLNAILTAPLVLAVGYFVFPLKIVLVTSLAHHNLTDFTTLTMLGNK
jgi:hypothetical protein